jgi:hypothetical protein
LNIIAYYTTTKNIGRLASRLIEISIGMAMGTQYPSSQQVLADKKGDMENLHTQANDLGRNPLHIG